MSLTNFRRSKEWWMKRAELEPDTFIGAGIPDTSEKETEGYAVSSSPTLLQRLWRMLGFHAPAMPLLTAEKLAEGWNEDIFVTTDLTVSFGDRLRILVSGRAKIATVVSTKAPVPQAITEVAFGVMPPGYRP